MKSLAKESPHELAMPSTPYYPSFHVDSQQMPEILNWEVGEEYPFKAKIKMTHKDESEHGAGSVFEITQYERKNKKLGD